MYVILYAYMEKNKINKCELKNESEIYNNFDDNELFFVNPPPP